jgi:hypothetical protein
MVIELAGPAGAGKSTVSQRLCHSLPASAAEIWGLPPSSLLGTGIRLVPAFAGLWLHARSPLWNETRHMVRLETLYRALQRPQPFSAGVVLFDEGPVFAMAWLRAFGHDSMRREPSAVWWRSTLEQWATVLDMVVVLDAPDQLLAHRIRERQRDHEVKNFSEDEIARWMTHFRSGLDWVLSGLTHRDGPVVVRLSSEEQAAELIAERLVDELSGTVYGR